MERQTRQYRLVLLGNVGVGKTSLAISFVSGEFHDKVETTVGASFLSNKIYMGDTIVKFDIWDTAGQERYRSLAPMYYRGAHAAIVVYDITSKDTFNKAQSWVNELRQRLDTDVVIALAGNKLDLAHERTVNTSEASEYARRASLLFMETSAKSTCKVAELFRAIAKQLVKLDEPPQQDHNKRKINLNKEMDERNSGGCCK